jgi:TPR repeat protein
VANGHGEALNDDALEKMKKKKNPQEVLKTFQLAAQANSVSALVNLGQIHSPFSKIQLEGVEKDLKTAEDYFREAADAKNVLATVRLADLLWKSSQDKVGARGEQLRMEAFKHFEWVADHGNREVQLQCGKGALMKGMYSRRNLSQGLRYLFMAAQK